MIIRLDINLSGKLYDHSLYNDSDLVQFCAEYFKEEVVIADTGFKKKGQHIINFIQGDKNDSNYNKNISEQLIRNEWSIRIV